MPEILRMPLEGLVLQVGVDLRSKGGRCMDLDRSCACLCRVVLQVGVDLRSRADGRSIYLYVSWPTIGYAGPSSDGLADAAGVCVLGGKVYCRRICVIALGSSILMLLLLSPHR